MAKSKLQEDETICYICNRPLTEKHKHHCFNGYGLRNKSEEDSMFVYVHPNCHLLIHNDPKLAKRIKAKAQERWEEEYSTKYECDAYESRTAFISRYGKNYGTDR